MFKSGMKGRTGARLVAGLPRLKRQYVLGLPGRPWADVCQSTTGWHKVPGLPRPAAVPGEQLALHA